MRDKIPYFSIPQLRKYMVHNKRNIKVGNWRSRRTLLVVSQAERR
ncbi:hypothetical protein [Gloeocapsopsis crepidinum]|nr:hypothetical protein [Gloeocapsopsis crepidinum]